jgi:hypothetical protein
MKLCIDHKLELFKRGQPIGGLAASPTAYNRADCDICNGTWKRNWDESQTRIREAEELKSA